MPDRNNNVTNKQTKMKTTQNITSLKAFCEASHLNPSLIRAVVRQIGGWEAFQQSAPDVCRGGIDDGFHGFIWNKDTEAFAKRNRALIADMAREHADDFGTGVLEMIRGFGCFRHGTKPTDEEIGLALYAGKHAPDGLNVLNALAWYAGEEVCRSFCDLTENN